MVTVTNLSGTSVRLSCVERSSMNSRSQARDVWVSRLDQGFYCKYDIHIHSVSMDTVYHVLVYLHYMSHSSLQRI